MAEEKPQPSATWNIAGLSLDVRATVILVLGTLLLTIDHYHLLLSPDVFGSVVRAKALERVIYYLIVPLLVITFAFRDRAAAYGLTVGDWKQGLKWTAVIILVALPILVVSARTPAMLDYYDKSGGSPAQVIINAALDLVGWEFFFRGFILFGLLRLVGPIAVVIQAVPFALAHLGKPELETLSTVFGGSLFGWVAWRSRSFIYPFLIHWAIYVTVVLVASSSAG